MSGVIANNEKAHSAISQAFYWIGGMDRWDGSPDSLFGINKKYMKYEE